MCNLYKVLYSLSLQRQNWYGPSTSIIPRAGPTSCHVSSVLFTWALLVLGHKLCGGQGYDLLIFNSPYRGRELLAELISGVSSKPSQRNKYKLHTSLFWRCSEVEGKGSNVFPGHTAIWFTASLFLKENTWTYYYNDAYYFHSFTWRFRRTIRKKFCDLKDLELHSTQTHLWIFYFHSKELRIERLRKSI